MAVTEAIAIETDVKVRQSAPPVVREARERMKVSRASLDWRTSTLISAALFLTGCPEASPTPTPDGSADQADAAVRADSSGPTVPSPDSSSPGATATSQPGPTSGAHGAPATDAPAAPVLGPSPSEHPGPWLWVRRSSAGVYEKPTTGKDGKIGYYKRGAKVAVLADKIQAPGCPSGWLQVLTGGVMCGLVGTMDEKDPLARFSPRQPNLDDILPYPYARNAQNGTPLYKSLPSRKQMLQYEPYLPAAKKAREALEQERTRDLEQMRAAGLAVGGEADPTAEGDAPLEGEAPPVAPKDVPLWEREENLHEITLDDLRKDADDVLAQRMMKGFYVAVDKTFHWNGRTWYKTTKGLVAPADRFWQTNGTEFRGVELDGEKWQLPVAFVVTTNKSVPTYAIDVATKKVLPKGSVTRMTALPLSYDYVEIAKTGYYRITDDTWIKDSHVRVTTPGPRPPEVGEHEHWVDIDLSEQTLVLFQGDRPLYATLISSGRESKIKDKDHSTPRGVFRVREKHVVSTMDGNGTAAGDMPYSIEDVPYIMYFHKSYATHGAFWHQNFGNQMSHGCVNLAPLDAKWIFFHSEPEVPDGMHGAWSSSSRPGSAVVVHD